MLHAVAEEGKMLLERREDINGRNASNQTPLKRAAEGGTSISYATPVDLLYLAVANLELTGPVALRFLLSHSSYC
jgi:hypothetical protein